MGQTVPFAKPVLQPPIRAGLLDAPTRGMLWQSVVVEFYRASDCHRREAADAVASLIRQKLPQSGPSHR